MIFLLISSISSYADGISFCGEDGHCYYEEEDTVAENPYEEIGVVYVDKLPIEDEIQPDKIQVAKVRTLSLNIHPKNGTVTLVNGELVYTPNSGFYGEDYFSYTDNDGKIRTVRLLIKAPGDEGGNSFSVSEVAPEPELKPTTYATTAIPGEPLIIPIAGDYQLGQQNLTINNPSYGKVTNNNDGTLTYTSDQDYSGKDNFSYKVADKYVFIVEVKIIRNPLPIMERVQLSYVDHTAVVRAGMTLTIDISANYSWKTQFIVINDSANSNIMKIKEVLFYSSNLDFKGYDNFSYIVTDKDNPDNSHIFRVRIEVQEESTVKHTSMNSCQVYAVDDKGIADSQLLSIDPSKYDPFEVNSLASFEIGPVYSGLDMEGMAIDPISNIVYGVTGGDYSSILDGRLYEINTNNGDIRDIGDTGFVELASLAFHSDGTLWGWSNKGSKDGTQGPGMILIDTQTAVGQLVYPMPEGLFDLRREGGVEGLAWSSDGSTLYATEGKKLWQWNCETGFKLQCPNVINLTKNYQVEALETLADGMLLFSIDNLKSNTAYVYNPENCTVIHEQPFKSVASNDDIESLVWPLNCQYAAPIIDEKVVFDNFSGSQKTVCLEEPQWIEVTGKVNIPNGSIGYLKTNWSSSEDTIAQCTSCGNCSEKWQTITSVTNQFKIKAWWPGMTGKSVTTNYTVELYDKNRDIISTDEVILVGNPAVCEATVAKPNKVILDDVPAEKKAVTETITTPPVSTEKDTAIETVAAPYVDPFIPSVANISDYLGSQIMQLNNDGSFTIQIENKVHSYRLRGTLPTLPHKALSISVTGDISNNGYADYSATIPSSTNKNYGGFQILYLGVTDVQSAIDSTIPNTLNIKRELESGLPNINNAGVISIDLNGQQHAYSFRGNTPLLPLSGMVTVIILSDINNDNYADYHVTDGNGNEYKLLYLGMKI
ncbi:MAG: cadherin-like domain-containing protein [Candidatus Marithrix sp.]|nr:cadherin-like domain-containing protein [Candidatus Marithrix sp.]